MRSKVLPYFLPLYEALAANKKCCSGVFSSSCIVYTEKGAFGGEEALTLLTVEEPYLGYWYGYICSYKNQPKLFASMLIRSLYFIDGHSEAALWANFYEWVIAQNNYDPCKVQKSGDAFAVSNSFTQAVSSLATMVERFDIDKRFPDTSSPLFNSLLELRTVKALSWWKQGAF